MRWLRIVLVSGMAAAALACGSRSGSAGDAGPVDGAAAPEVPASPVLVGHVAAGFRAVVAGRGMDSQDWGDEETEAGNPFTVLAPAGQDASSDRAVVVSTSGLVANLYRVACCTVGAQRSRIDGRDALFAPAAAGRWAQLAVVRGDDVAVLVTAADGGRDDLAAIARRVEPQADHSRAPTVPHPPRGLKVVGSVDAGAVLSVFPAVAAGSGHVPGTPRRSPPGGCRARRRA